jgi:hypothetical protein
MSTSHLKQAIGVCIALAAAAVAGCGDNAPSTEGVVRVNIAAVPSDVLSVIVVVSGDFTPDIRQALTGNLDGSWSGSVADVPAGVARTVTGYAYNTMFPPDDLTDTTNLIFKGATTGVMVIANTVNNVDLVLSPFPPHDTTVNTPPLLVSLTHAATVGTGGTTTLKARALDPDLDDSLTYTWVTLDDVGSFDVNPVTPVTPGTEIATVYTAPASAQTVHFGLTVTDLHGGSSSTTFTLAVVSTGAVGVDATFEAMPNVSIDSISPRTVLPGEATTIDYTLTANSGETPSPVTAGWSVSEGCGSFGTFDATPDLITQQSVLFTAPLTGIHDVQCNFTLTLTSNVSGAQQVTTFVVWEPARIVFVTSTGHDGSFGSVSSADSFCSDSAAAGGLPGTYKAFLSATGTGQLAVNHIDESMYALPDGTFVAPSKESMFDVGLAAFTPLQHAIDMDEFGQTHTDVGAFRVFTGTTGLGQLSTLGVDVLNCQDWDNSSDSLLGTAGSTGSALSPDWIDSGTLSCDQEASLYCFQAVED